MPRARNPQANRTDLATPKAAPNRTAPDQTYGKQTAQQQSMKIQPLTPPGESAPQPVGAPSPIPAAPAGAPQAGPEPALFTRPTERPNEPISHGAPFGPGPGPESLTGVGALANQQENEQGTLQQLLGHLASQPGASSVLKGLAANAGVPVA